MNPTNEKYLCKMIITIELLSIALKKKTKNIPNCSVKKEKLSENRKIMKKLVSQRKLKN